MGNRRLLPMVSGATWASSVEQMLRMHAGAVELKRCCKKW